MIPDLDSNGNLPPGTHLATISQILERFPGKSLRRKHLSDSLNQFCFFIREHAEEIYLGGSYVTRKMSPNDVDLIVILQPGFDWIGSSGRRLLEFQNFRRYRLHLLICRHNERGLRNKRLKLFATTKNMPPLKKGLIKLEVGHDKKR